MWAQCKVSRGSKDLRRVEVSGVTWGRQCLYKTNINCATSSEDNGGQDTKCALIHISIVCPSLLLLLWAWSISGVKGGGDGGEDRGAAGGQGGVWLCSFSSVCVRMHRRFSSNLMCVPGDIWWIKAKQLHFAAPPDLPLPVPHIKAGVIADLS